uniref:Uncharacterized protein n=1 Tax=Arundo donax TaxID=35708 RepID=A0A0A9AKQ5_ARUDO
MPRYVNDSCKIFSDSSAKIISLDLENRYLML